MALDYDKIAAMAKRLLDANGRAVTLRRLSRSVDDVARPWRGSTTPRDPYEYSHTVVGVFVEPYSLVRYGFTREDIEEMKRVDVVILTSGLDITALGIDGMGVDEILDSSSAVNYRVQKVQELAPSTTKLMYVFGASR